MASDIDIRATLEENADLFGPVALELVQIMFGASATIHEPWRVYEYLQGDFDYTFVLYSSNRDYKSTTAIGIGYEGIAAFLGHPAAIEEARDAFGEFANNYCALLMDDQRFVNVFGVLVQSPPEDAIMQACFPRAWCVGGCMHVGEHPMYIGFSVQPITFRLEDLDAHV